MNYGILNLGAVTAVNFMIRNVMSGMVKLMNNQANSTIFSNSVFHDIDDYIYYLFKIYKALTNQIMNSVEGISNNINQNISIIVIFEIIILILALIIWIARINTEKKKLSNLYAQVLQLPQIIFRENKIILKILEENLTLKL